MVAIVKSFRIFDIGLRRRRRATPLRDQIVLGSVDGNSIKPRIKSTVAAKVRQRPVRLDKGFLRHVFDLGRIAYQPRKQPKNLALILDDKQVKCGFIAALHALDQLLVDVSIRHAAGGSSRGARVSGR